MPSTLTSSASSPSWRDWPPEAKQRLRDRLAAEAAKLRPRDPLGWAAHHGLHWWSAQRAIAESVDRNKRTAVRAGHGVGKTYTAAGLAAWWIDTRPDGMVVSTAPSAHQVHAILWEEIRALHRRLNLPGRVLLNDTWTMGDRLVGFGRKPPDAAKGSDFDPSTFQGIHRSGGVLVIIDEGGGVPEWLFTAAETITTTDNSRILVIGNPDNPGSQFAQVCTPGHPGWAQQKISVFDSPNYTGEAVPAQVAAALTPRSWAAERADEWGEDSPLYLSKVMAEFPSDHPQQVVPLSALLACRVPEPRSAAELAPVELGVDVGGGSDLTVVRERRGMKAGRRWMYRGSDPEKNAQLVMDAIRITGATSVKVDGNGVGHGLVGDLRNRIRRGDAGRDVAVHSVMVGEASSEPLIYGNLRAELWWVIGRESSQQGTWDLSGMDEAEKTKTELLLPRVKYDAKGRIFIESKEDIRSRTSGKSPDDADALLLAFHVPRDAQGSYWEALNAGKLR